MFLQNQVLNDTYQILQPIGKGGTSSVYLGYHLRLRKYVVIKQLRGSFSDDFLLRTEVDILKNLHHPYLPQVYDFIQDRDNIYTIIDYVDGADLEQYTRSKTPLPEPYLKRYLRQIAEVLAYLHSQSPAVIHSDIKPGNIILNQEGNAILIDFNTSIGGNQGNLLGLTLPYASPEQIEMANCAVNGVPAGFELDGRSDLYSLGATFYELISGIQPTPGVPLQPLHTMALPEYSRDFLVLIDRMIEYDREKRIKSAKKLVSAIDKLDSRYRTYFALRCATVLVSAALIGGGIYCCIRGTNRAGMEQFQSQYRSVTALISQGSLDQAEVLCDGILADNSLQAYLQDRPLELAKLYHAYGDIAYYNEDYNTAAAYYSSAVNLTGSTGGSELSTYLRDAAIAYAQAGQLDAANSVLQTAADYNVDSDDLTLVSVVILAREGKTQECLTMAQQLLGECSDSEICLRAALSAASAAEDFNTKIAWYERAQDYGGGKNVTRAMAMAYAEYAQGSYVQADKDAALQKSLTLYAQLCDADFVSSVDAVNYSVVLRMAGRKQDAANVLLKALENAPTKYRLMANLGFVYYELRDSTRAKEYCAAAITAWRSHTSADRLSEYSDEIQNLLELAGRLGVGG